jgi:two-component system response regulator RegA
MSAESESGGDSVLVIDGDDAFRSRIGRALERKGYRIRTCGGDQALALAREENPDFAIVDLRMPAGLGQRLVRELIAIDPRVRIVALTAYGYLGDALQAVRDGASSYLQKPVTAVEIERALRALGDEGEA